MIEWISLSKVVRLACWCALLGAITLACGIGKNQSGTGNTNWQLVCELDDDCPSGQFCQCGLCGPRCEGKLTCEQADDETKVTCELGDAGLLDVDGDASDGVSDDAAPGDVPNDAASPNDAPAPDDAASPNDGSAPNAPAETPEPDSGVAPSTTLPPTDCSLSDTWTEMDTEYEVGAGSNWAGPETAAGLWLEGELFVLDAQFRLFAFEPCANAWRSVDVDWTLEALSAEVPTRRIDRVVADAGRFTLYDDVSEKTAVLDPLDGTWRPGDYGVLFPQLPQWQLSEGVVRRIAGELRAEHYTLHWGGVERATDDQGDPLTIPMGNGQVMDRETGLWSEVALDGAPSPRAQPTVTASGNRFVVFGGFAETDGNDVIAASALNDGAIYDPVSDSWSAMSSPEFPLSPNAEAGFVGVPGLAAPAALERVYLIDAETGAGGIYHLPSDTWQRVEATEERFWNRWEFALDGSLLTIGSDEGLKLDPETSQWTLVPYGSPAPQGTNTVWVVEVFNGSDLFRWGASTTSQSGCDDAPPGVGCDPVIEYTTAAIGAMIRLAP